MKLYKSNGTKVRFINPPNTSVEITSNSLDEEPNWSNQSRQFTCSVEAYYRLNEPNVVSVWIDDILIKQFHLSKTGAYFQSVTLISELPLSLNQLIVVGLNTNWSGDFKLIIPYTVTIIGE